LPGEPLQALRLHMSPSSARRQPPNLGLDAGSLPGSQQSRGGGKWNSTRRPLPSGRNGSAFRGCSSGRQKRYLERRLRRYLGQRFESFFLQQRVKQTSRRWLVGAAVLPVNWPYLQTPGAVSPLYRHSAREIRTITERPPDAPRASAWQNA
jgi:hypothetical protein